MTTTGVDPDLVEMMNAVFADYRASDSAQNVVKPGDELWRRLDELGLVRLTGAEDTGGSGAGWFEAAELLTAAARHGVRIPLAENDLLANWLLESVGVAGDPAVRTVCRIDDDGTATGVPWASCSDRIVVVRHTDGGYSVADVGIDKVAITPGTNMIGEPRDTVCVDIAAWDGMRLPADSVAQLLRKSALVRSIQICAALDRALELSIEHVTSREQFGRTLSKFQAVQHLIADIAAEAALARTATEGAVSNAVASDWSDTQLDFLVAAARSCTGHAASAVVRDAHQVLGAIGTTREHRLHEYTRAALAWRSEFGSVRHWDEQLTDMALRAGAGGLWQLICP